MVLPLELTSSIRRNHHYVLQDKRSRIFDVQYQHIRTQGCGLRVNEAGKNHGDQNSNLIETKNTRYFTHLPKSSPQSFPVYVLIRGNKYPIEQSKCGQVCPNTTVIKTKNYQQHVHQNNNLKHFLLFLQRAYKLMIQLKLSNSHFFFFFFHIYLITSSPHYFWGHFHFRYQ